MHRHIARETILIQILALAPVGNLKLLQLGWKSVSCCPVHERMRVKLVLNTQLQDEPCWMDVWRDCVVERGLLFGYHPRKSLALEGKHGACQTCRLVCKWRVLCRVGHDLNACEQTGQCTYIRRCDSLQQVVNVTWVAWRLHIGTLGIVEDTRHTVTIMTLDHTMQILLSN